MDALVSDLARSWDEGPSRWCSCDGSRASTNSEAPLRLTYNSWLLARLEDELPAEVWDRISTALAAYERREWSRVATRWAAGRVRRRRRRRRHVLRLVLPWLRPRARRHGERRVGGSPDRRWPPASLHVLRPEPLGRPAPLPPERGAGSSSLRRLTATERATRERLAVTLAAYAPDTAGRREQYEAVQAAGLVELKQEQGTPWRPCWSTRCRSRPRDRAAAAVGGRAHPRDPDLLHLLDRYPAAGKPRPDAARGVGAGNARGHDLLCVLIATAARLGSSADRPLRRGRSIVGTRPWTEPTRSTGPIHAFVDLSSSSGSIRARARVARAQPDRDASSRRSVASTCPNDRAGGLHAQRCAQGVRRPARQAAADRRPRAPGERDGRPAVPDARLSLLMLCTDVLQEGEDLHTFCDRVIHYGVAWTASSMEQRIGRVDRIQSLTERRLRRITAEADR